MQKSGIVVIPELILLIIGDFSEIYKCILPPELQTSSVPPEAKISLRGDFFVLRAQSINRHNYLIPFMQIR